MDLDRDLSEARARLAWSAPDEREEAQELFRDFRSQTRQQLWKQSCCLAFLWELKMLSK